MKTYTQACRERAEERTIAVGDDVITYDAKCEPWVSLFKWRISQEGTNKYAVADLPAYFGGQKIRMHGLVMYVCYGERRFNGRMIDHADGNGLNNLRSNLRLATPAENNRNKRGRPKVSAHKGVQWVERRRHWTASIVVDRKAKYLGAFKEELEAAHAYNEAAKELFGEFAKLNDLERP